MTGELGILNVGAGDTKLTFDPAKPAERDRAARIVTDMLKRGFAILVQVGEKDGKPLFQRAEAFDPETCEYVIVADGPADQAPIDAPDAEEASASPPAPAPAGKKKRGRKTTRIAAEKTRAVSVARSAGG